jgi:DNA invertase Pin-like site-specific DNA recombinase
MEKKKAVGYIRVSTMEQVRDGCSLEMQKQKIQMYVDLKDLELVGIKSDEGISAKNITGRPGFQEALRMVFAGEADALIVWKIDRAFRSTKDALNVSERLTKKKKELHSITESIDTSSAFGEFSFTLLAAQGQLERRLIGERTKAALDSKRDRGEKLGGNVPYGFFVHNGMLRDNEEEQEVVGLMKRYHIQGLSIRKIVAQLEADGYVGRNGKPFNPKLVHKIVNE